MVLNRLTKGRGSGLAWIACCTAIIISTGSSACNRSAETWKQESRAATLERQERLRDELSGMRRRVNTELEDSPLLSELAAASPGDAGAPGPSSTAPTPDMHELLAGLMQEVQAALKDEQRTTVEPPP